jgi:type I restriction enzyme, S subunit
MAAEWRASTWGEEISLEYGKALRGHDESRGRYRVFGANGPIGWTSEPLVNGPGVVLGRKGAYRGVEYSREPFFVIDTAYYVVPKSQLDMRWLYYAIKHYKLGDVDDGSPIPSTTRAAVYMLDLDVPPPGEQRAIAHILGTLDDKIELNRRLNETLEAMARSLFQSWFVDFDPVRAKAEGHDPGLPKPLADLFPDSFEDSELGEIPVSWKVGSVDDEFDLTMGQSPPGDTYNEAGEGLPFYQGRADFGVRFPSRRVYCTAPTRLAKAGDTLISVRAP